MKYADSSAALKNRGYPSGYRASVLSRVLAAVFGGYALATMLPILLSRLMPMPKAEAVITAMLLSFVIYACAVLWVFAARTASKAWRGLLIPTAVCAVWWWMLAS